MYGVLAALLGGCSLPPVFGSLLGNRVTDVRPVVTLAPAKPCVGDRVRLQGSQGPADSTIEVWLMPQMAGGFKAGVYLPREVGGVKLGDARVDHAGGFAYDFTFERPAFDQNGGPQGSYAIWLIYPPGNVVAPDVTLWQCPAAE